MKRTDEKRSVVTYHLTPEEHERALKEYIESHKAECGKQGFVPLVAQGSVVSVTCSWEEGNGAAVEIVYTEGPKSAERVRCAESKLADAADAVQRAKDKEIERTECRKCRKYPCRCEAMGPAA